MLLLLGLFVLRWVVHFALFSDGVAVAEIAGIDAGAVLVLVLSFALGPNVGRHFGSITLYFVIVGLAIAGVGYLAEVIRYRHLSLMSAFITIMGAGAGLCLATRTWNQAIWITGLLAIGGASYGLTRVHQPFDALVIASPYVLSAIVFVITGARRGSAHAVAG
ncbi:hypothetical protein WMF11_08635 [Sorangium sp. So ce295]|uniref:hypothetical protein n=1 Tax=Sorangium sp. So ce295 TaxID=3133295 RepID=UPI003F628A14